MFQALKKLADLSAAGFKEIGAGDSEHLAAIGRFIVSFSTHIHLRLTALLQIQLNLYEEAAKRAVVGDMSIAQAMAAVLRIAEARSLDAETLRSMKQLWNEIHRLHGVRGKIAHRSCVVAGTNMAFHNALSARSEATIEIEIYSIKELNEFSEYAERLGFRLLLLMAPLVRKRLPNNEIGAGLVSFSLLMSATRKFIEEKKIVGKTVKEAKERMAKAHAALNAYADTMTENGAKLTEQEYEANSAMYEFGAWLGQISAPAGRALYEIPARLRKPTAERRNP